MSQQEGPTKGAAGSEEAGKDKKQLEQDAAAAALATLSRPVVPAQDLDKERQQQQQKQDTAVSVAEGSSPAAVKKKKWFGCC